jgi:hypothetical protein
MDLTLEPVGDGRAVMVGVRVGGEVVDPARVREKVPKRDRARIVSAGAEEIVVLAWELTVDGVIEREPPLLDEPHRRRGHERLRHARDSEPGAWPERFARREVRDARRDLDVDAETRGEQVEQSRRHRRPCGNVFFDEPLQRCFHVHDGPIVRGLRAANRGSGPRAEALSSDRGRTARGQGSPRQLHSTHGL